MYFFIICAEDSTYEFAIQMIKGYQVHVIKSFQSYVFL